MNPQPQPGLHRLLQLISRAASALVMLVGSVVLLGWMFDIQSLKSVSPNWVTMKANTAVCFVLTGLSLWILSNEQTARRSHLLAQGCSAIVAAVALLTLGEYLLGLDFGIDQLLFKESPAAVETSRPGQMAPATAFDFLLVSLALLGLDWKTQTGLRLAQVLALLAAIIGLLAFVGYLYGVKSLYAISPYSSMAVHTALLFVVTSIGVLVARPGQESSDILTSEGVGSAMARRLLPFAILLPLALGWLRLAGERAGWYGFEVGLALFATSSVFTFSVLIWLTAVWLNRADASRKRADDALRESERRFIDEQKQAADALRGSERRFRLAVEAAPNGMLMVSSCGEIVLANLQIEKLFGYRKEELLGQSVEILVPERFRSRHAMHRGGFLADLKARAMGTGRELLGQHKDGSELPLEIGLNPMHTESGDFVLASVIDITERKRWVAEMVRARLGAIVESANDAIIGKNLDGIITSWNSAAGRIYGYAAEEAIGQPIDIIVPTDRTEESQALLGMIRRGEPIKHRETVHVTKDGKHVHVSLTISPILDQNGVVVGASVIGRDISERKHAEEQIRAALEEKEVLLREIHHRVKNNLTVISSLFYLQSTYLKDESVLRLLQESQDRIRSMALVHETLYLSPDPRDVNFGEYVQSLAAQLFRTYCRPSNSPALTTDIRPVTLDIAAAIPCGMILNELITNCLKHAFPADMKGGVFIGLYLNEKRDCVLRVSDTGVGIPPDLDLRQTRSLGLRLVRLLAAQLDGKIEINRANPGTSVQLTFPIGIP